jgi:hypothetical protein
LHAAIYTDSRITLTDALGIRNETQIGTIDGTTRGSGWDNLPWQFIQPSQVLQ